VAACNTFLTFDFSSGHLAAGSLLIVTKSPSSNTLLTPVIAKSALAIGCPSAASPFRKLVGLSEIGLSSTNLTAFGFGVGCISRTTNGITDPAEYTADSPIRYRKIPQIPETAHNNGASMVLRCLLPVQFQLVGGHLLGDGRWDEAFGEE
jgi:hypothetical protein